MITPFTTGFAAGFSLILAIGAQNAFVFRQGLRREHIFWLCLFCAASDAILVTLGVLGFGAMVRALPGLPHYMALAGAVFLFVYGALRFSSAYQGGHSMRPEGNTQSLATTLTIAAGFTWANPHVYLDTVGLLGAISTTFHGTPKVFFAVGAILSSFVFFFGLGFGARLLAPMMRSQRAWVIADLAIGVLMWWLSFELYTYA